MCARHGRDLRSQSGLTPLNPDAERTLRRFRWLQVGVVFECPAATDKQPDRGQAKGSLCRGDAASSAELGQRDRLSTCRRYTGLPRSVTGARSTYLAGASVDRHVDSAPMQLRRGLGPAATRAKPASGAASDLLRKIGRDGEI